MAFLQKKKSTNLYFSLPIKKESLFITTSLFSLFATIIPVVIDFTIAIVLTNNIGNRFFDTSFGSLILTVFQIIIYMLVTQGLTTCITLLCQNTFDSFVVNVAYVLAPCLLFLGLLINASICAESIMIGQGNYASIIENLIYYLSFPYTGFYQVFYTIQNNDIISFIPTLYWFIIMVISYVLSYRLFIKRRAEMSENHTQSLFMYPLLIVIVTFSLILTVFNLSNNDFSDTFLIMTLAFIFVVYLIMYYVSVRKVYFNWKIPAVFILLLAGSLGFTQIYQSTQGFGTLSEYPSEEYDGKLILVTNFSKNVKFENSEINYMTLDSRNGNTRQLIIQFQKEILKSGMISKDFYSDEYACISLFYSKEKNNDSVNRHYYIVDQENINKYLKMYENLLKTIKSNKDYTCHHYEYQQGNE